MISYTERCISLVGNEEWWGQSPSILDDINSLIISNNISILEISSDTLINIENEPEEIKSLINTGFIINNYVQYKYIPLALKYKINRNIANLEKMAKYMVIDEYTQNPLCACYSHKSPIRFQILMCIQCGNYIIDKNSTKNVAKNAQCLCKENRYKSEYMSNVINLLLLHQTNINHTNKLQYEDVITYMESQIIKYNNNTELNELEYSDSGDSDNDNDNDFKLPISISYISISDAEDELI
jgi:hypothetical protein